MSTKTTRPDAADHTAIEALLLEERTFPPSPEFRAQANVSDPAIV